MKYYKLIFFLFFATFLLTSNAIATSSGNGCKIGQDYVYTRYLGKTSAYVGTPEILYYDSNGPKIPIYWGYGCNDCRGYRCGYINMYGATSYYDPTIPPHGGTVYVSAEQEMTSLGVQCVIAPSLGASPIRTDTHVFYTYNKTDKCDIPQTNVPFDSHVWIMLLITGLVGVYFLKIKIA